MYKMSKKFKNLFALIIAIITIMSCTTVAFASSPQKGIDVSQWQGDINWPAVKNSGIKFAMIRTGFGRNEPNQTDKKFYQNIKGAQSVGIETGVYHYCYAVSAQDAVNEADFCLSIIKGYKLSYPVVLDIEDDSMIHLGNRELTEIVKAFCNRIEKAGYYACVYCNPNWINNYLYKNELFPRYDLWLAHWEIAAPSCNCGIWQHTSTGKVPGINGYVDLDYSYKDYPSIMKSRHLNGF